MDLTTLHEWIQAPAAIQIAAVAPGLTPQSVRGFGMRVEQAAVLCVGVVEAQAPALLAGLTAGSLVAVNLTHPLSFRGRQVKGPLLALEPASSEAALAAHEYFARFSLLLGKIGLSPAQCRGLFFDGPTRWLRVRAEQVFDQTPGPGAGGRL